MTATVTLDGRNVTGVTLNGLTITRGRSSIYEDINPGVCVATLLSGDIAPDAWQGQSGYTDIYSDIWQGLSVAARVGVPMAVETSGESGYTDIYSDVWQGGGAVRFTGVVTAVDYTPGELTITAVDALEALGRVYVTAARPPEMDFARAFALGRLAGIDIGYMGTTQVQLVGIDAATDPVTALTALVQVADNTDAQLLANLNNKLFFRRRDTAPPGVITLPSDVTFSTALVVSDELGAVYNVQRVAYGEASGRSIVERVNQSSITEYGRREWRQYDTQLATTRDASDLAAYWLENDSAPGYRIRNVDIFITDDDNKWAATADSIDLYTPVHIPQITPGSPIDTYTAVVLGYTETITTVDRVLSIQLAHPGYLMKGSSYALAPPAR